MGSARIPVVILAGHLGAGKTTLLNHLLGNADGLRIGVVVNDFGSVNIDAMSVAGHVDSTVSLSNGCLCCAVDASGLDDLLGRLARPSRRLDVIVVEASGLAEPRDLIRLLLASDNDAITYGGLVEVVDAVEFERTRERHPEVDAQLRVADLVVLNKVDRLAADDRHRLTAVLRDIVEEVPVVATTRGRLDPGLLFDRRLPAQSDSVPRQLSFDELLAATRHDHDHLHEHYEAVDFVTDQALHPRRLMDFLDARPTGLYRIKGFVHFGVPGHRERYTVHAVGSFLRFEPTRWRRGEGRTSTLVLIGNGVDPEDIRARLRACEEPAPHALPPESMLCVLRHTQH
ncbi:CobW family GTP-binding protein [Actinoalloteichus spitiensis]|uniref:CobW family GTP-binding protein n=1 Tax=Actinoalloteichus spitiensis TaxID=252394 RepID=UPI000368BCA1|nr:GTP-binding protein [Actinoalloteichus spitiensis]